MPAQIAIGGNSMLNRLVASLGLVLAAFAATTGVSNAAIDSRSEVMYVTAAVVIGIVVILSIAYATAHALGLDKPSIPEPDEEERGIRASGFGEEAFDRGHIHESHDSHPLTTPHEDADVHSQATTPAHGH